MAYDYDASTDVETITERASNPSAPSSGRWNAYFTPNGWVIQDDLGNELGMSPVNAGRMADGRLTLSSGVPVSTSDVLAATTLYYVPYIGNQIALYNTTLGIWQAYTFTERSLSLAGLTANLPRDIFLYDNAGTLTLESVAWSSDTARVTALVKQNDIYVQSGAANKRYLGTMRTTGTTGQSEDGLLNRLVWNYYHRLLRRMLDSEATNHTYNSGAAYRAWNNTVGAVRNAFVVGVIEDNILLSAGGSVANTGILNAGLNSTTAPAVGFSAVINNNAAEIEAGFVDVVYPALGFNFTELIELGSATPASFTNAFLETGVWM